MKLKLAFSILIIFTLWQGFGTPQTSAYQGAKDVPVIPNPFHYLKIKNADLPLNGSMTIAGGASLLDGPAYGLDKTQRKGKFYNQGVSLSSRKSSFAGDYG